MQLIKELILIVGLLALLGTIFLFMDGGKTSEAEPQLEKPTMWGNDVRVHTGNVSRYLRNGFSSDYDEDTDDIYVAVAGHTSGPDTCFLYRSTNGGANWSLYHPWHWTSNISNPQVIVGQDEHHYLFLFGRVEEENGNIVLKWRALPAGGWTQDTISGSSRGIKNFVVTREQGGVYNLHLAYSSDSCDVFYMRSTNYGQNWTNYLIVDGDMPDLAVGGYDGSEDIFLVWRLDGEKGALYTADDHGKVKKNKDFMNNKWYLTSNMSTSDTAFCIYQDPKSGAIFVGTGNDGDVYKSEDGGKTWSLTGNLSGAEHVYDLSGDGGRIVAATGEPARIFYTTNAGEAWIEDLELSGEEAFLSLAYDTVTGNFYAGTTPQGDVYKKQYGHDWDWIETYDLLYLDDVRSIIATKNGTILAAGRDNSDSSHMFRSTNQGQIWLYKGPKLYRYWCIFQALDGAIYASGFQYGFNIFLKSTNDGDSWTYLPNTPTAAKFIYQDSDSVLYIGNNYDPTYKSTNKGNSWQPFTGSSEVMDMIQTRPVIVVKRSVSPNRGTLWEPGQILSVGLSDFSDPKVAALFSSPPKVWMAYSERSSYGDWDLKYAYCNVSLWSKNLYLRGQANDGADQQMCDLRCHRGDTIIVHAAYYDDDAGSRMVYYRSATRYFPDFGYQDTLSISGIVPTTYHTPEISFYQQKPMVFFSGQAFAIPSPYPNNLYVDAQQFTRVDQEAEEEQSQVNGFSLSQNYPNPFNPITTSHFTVGGSQFMVHSPIHTTLKIYNVLGEMIRILVDGEKLSGNYAVIWDGRDDQGKEVASGIYFCRLEVGDKSQTNKMLLIK